MRSYSLFALIAAFSCSSNRDCPGTLTEPVSVCRAQEACNTRSPLKVIGVILGGAGAGMSGQRRNAAADSVDACIDRNLAAQRSNAGIMDTHTRCKIREVATDTYQTDCD